MYIGLQVKYPLFLSDYNETDFSRHISKYLQIIKCNGNFPVTAESFHADTQKTYGQT